MRQKSLQVLRMIWEKKMLLFLILALLYIGTAALLHQMYQNGVFAEKSYNEGQYSLTVRKTKEEGTLDCVVDYVDSDLAEEAAEDGDHFRMDKDKICYGDDVYEYETLSSYSGFGDYKVTFPDGNTYYIEKESNYYMGAMSEEEAVQTAAVILDSMGITDTEKDALDEMPDIPMLTLVDAPDAEYSPELIRSALLTYQSYYDENSIWDSEDVILKITGILWFVYAFILCTLKFWMGLDLLKLSWRISYMTKDIAPQLEPSDGFRMLNIALCVLVLAGDYIAMIGFYMHLR